MATIQVSKGVFFEAFLVVKTQVELIETILLLIANFLDLDILLIVDFLDPREGEGGGVLRLHMYAQSKTCTSIN